MTALAAIQTPGADTPGGAAAGRRVRAALRFACDGRGRSFLQRSRTPYPFHVTRPFRFEGDPDGMATLYLQSASGGVYAGDQLDLAVALGADSQVHLSTQASTIVHAARDGTPAEMTTTLQAGAGAFLEWLPDPTILLADARLESTTEAVLEPGARLLLGEAFLSHAPWGGDAPFASFASEIRVRDAEGRTLALDRAQVDGAAWCDGGPAAMAGYRAHALLLGVGLACDAEALAALRAALAEAAPAAYAGVSVLRDGAGWSARILAPDAVVLRAGLDALWRAARVTATGQIPRRRPK